MPTDRKFYKTTVTVTVLSEESFPDFISLRDLADEEERSGGWVADTSQEPTQELNGKEAADALSELRSEPETFNLTEDGEDAENE